MFVFKIAGLYLTIVTNYFVMHPVIWLIILFIVSKYGSLSSSALPYPSLDLILLSSKSKDKGSQNGQLQKYLDGRLTIRPGAMAEQGKPLEEILLAAKEVTSTLMRRFIILEY